MPEVAQHSSSHHLGNPGLCEQHILALDVACGIRSTLSMRAAHGHRCSERLHSLRDGAHCIFILAAAVAPAGRPLRIRTPVVSAAVGTLLTHSEADLPSEPDGISSGNIACVRRVGKCCSGSSIRGFLSPMHACMHSHSRASLSARRTVLDAVRMKEEQGPGPRPRPPGGPACTNPSACRPRAMASATLPPAHQLHAFWAGTESRQKPWHGHGSDQNLLGAQAIFDMCPCYGRYPLIENDLYPTGTRYPQQWLCRKGARGRCAKGCLRWRRGRLCCCTSQMSMGGGSLL